MPRAKSAAAPVSETPENEAVEPQTEETAENEQDPVQTPETPEGGQETEDKKEEEELPGKILTLMRLYPQYEKIWINTDGFVHPNGVPPYLQKGATLYTNKSYNK